MKEFIDSRLVYLSMTEEQRKINMTRDAFDGVGPHIAEIEQEAPGDGAGELVNISCTLIARHPVSLRGNYPVMNECAVPGICNSEHLWHAVTGIDFTLYPAFDPAHPVSSRVYPHNEERSKRSL